MWTNTSICCKRPFFEYSFITEEPQSLLSSPGMCSWGSVRILTLPWSCRMSMDCCLVSIACESSLLLAKGQLLKHMCRILHDHQSAFPSTGTPTLFVQTYRFFFTPNKLTILYSLYSILFYTNRYSYFRWVQLKLI